MTGLTFRVVDGDYINYEEAKSDYENGIRGDKLREKHHIGNSQYKRLLTRFHEDGVEVTIRRTPTHKKPHYNPKNYHKQMVKGIMYFVVFKIINGEKYSFGRYKSEAKAKKRVKELRENNWEGLL